MNPLPPSSTELSRRRFLQASSLAAGALAFPSILKAENKPDRIRIGLVGCGGRGTGAAHNALVSDPNVQLVAVGDVFAEKAEDTAKTLISKYAATPERIDLPKERQFSGLDAYKKVLESGIDCVLLATPPAFRPTHFEAAISAGKHIFCEKPMATDAVGVRKVLELSRLAKTKGLSVVAGFCWRYDMQRRALFSKIQAGDIGEIRALYHTYMGGPVKPMPPVSSRKAEWGDLEWQLRNWSNFVWLAGDGIVEQACHSVDKMMWAMSDKPPLRCTATGGRQHPNIGGDIYDHMTVVYEWENGVRGVMAQRQMANCFNDNSDYVYGQKGVGTTKGGNVRSTGGEADWKAAGNVPKGLGMYEQEHKELYASIRAGTAHNDGEWMCQSNLAAIMGRMAAYTGQEVTWEHMLKSEESLVPTNIHWEMQVPEVRIASPGFNKVV